MSNTEIVVHEDFEAALKRERATVYEALSRVKLEHLEAAERAAELQGHKEELEVRLRLIDSLIKRDDQDQIPF